LSFGDAATIPDGVSVFAACFDSMIAAHAEDDDVGASRGPSHDHLESEFADEPFKEKHEQQRQNEQMELARELEASMDAENPVPVVAALSSPEATTKAEEAADFRVELASRDARIAQLEAQLASMQSAAASHVAEDKSDDMAADDAAAAPIKERLELSLEASEAEPDEVWEVVVQRTFIAVVPKRRILPHVASAPGRLTVPADGGCKQGGASRRRSRVTRRASSSRRKARARQADLKPLVRTASVEAS